MIHPGPFTSRRPAQTVLRFAITKLAFAVFLWSPRAFSSSTQLKLIKKTTAAWNFVEIWEQEILGLDARLVKF
jgi:hypothetical protein